MIAIINTGMQAANISRTSISLVPYIAARRQGCVTHQRSQDMNIKDLSRTTTTGATPYVALDSKLLAQLAEMERKELERNRSSSKATRATVQMSIRMEEEEYLRFRALCKAERRTNGDMLLHLMTSFLHQDV